MANVTYKISGTNARQIAEEIRTLQMNSSAYRQMEQRALEAGYTTIEVRSGAGFLGAGSSHSPSPGVWHMDIAADRTGQWASGERQVYVGEVIAHELGHANVPPQFRDPPGVFDQNGPSETWVRNQTGYVAQDLNLPGKTNADSFLIEQRVVTEQVCTPANPQGNNYVSDGVKFLDGSRGYNGIGETRPPRTGGDADIEIRRLGTTDQTEEVIRPIEGSIDRVENTYSPDGDLSHQQQFNKDGSSAASGYDSDGNERWHVDQRADGAGSFSSNNGNQASWDNGVAFSLGEDGRAAQFTHSGSETVTVRYNADGSTEVKLNNGPEITALDPTKAEFSANAVDFSGGAEGGGSDTGGGDSGDAGKGWPPTQPSPPTDPLVLDLDGDGVELISVAQSHARFDYDKDGFAEKTGWVGSDDGFLVFDRDGDNQVDGIDELFGNQTVDGFASLAQIDSNADGKIDASDTDFSSLRVWRDLDGDGQSDAGEVFSLADVGVSSINLAKTPSTQKIAGNDIGFTGTFVHANGEAGDAAAVFFQTDRGNTRWVAPEGFVLAPEARDLPNIRGYGQLRDLRYEMTLNETLRGHVRDFVLDSGSKTAPELRAAIEQIMLEWAGVGNVAAGSRGPNIDAQKLTFLEKFFGSPISQNGQPNPDARYAAGLSAVYQTISAGFLTRFLASVPASLLIISEDALDAFDSPFVLLSQLKYNAGPDRFAGDAEAVLAKVVAAAPADAQAKVAYFGQLVEATKGLQFDFFEGSQQGFKQAYLDALDAAGSLDAALRAYIMELIETTATVGTPLDDLDLVLGDGGKNIIIAGAGDDSVAGGFGNDIYVYARGDGNDVVTEAANEGINDTLLLVGINRADVSFVRTGANEVKIVIAPSVPGGSDGGSIIIKNAGDEFFDQGLEKLVFADGTVMSRADLRAAVIAAAMTSGNDTIDGFDSDDTLNGVAGDDVLRGGGSDDTYIYARGDGNDTIIEAANEGSADKLVLLGINRSEVTSVRSGVNQITLLVAPSIPGGSDGGSIIIKDAGDEFFDQGLEQIVFADGTMTREDLRVAVLAQSSTSGNDAIRGFDATDTLAGGAGNDELRGGGQSDTYVYARGDGNDTIIEEVNQGSADKLVLVGINRSDVTFVRSGANQVTLVIAPSTPNGSDGGSIVISDALDDYFDRGLEQIAFADGVTMTRADLRATVLAQTSTAGDDLITGSGAADAIAGGGGDDQLRGGGGNDTYVYARGDGNDTIIEEVNQGSADKLVLVGINRADVTFVRSAVNEIKLVIAPLVTDGSDGGSIVIKNAGDEYFDQGLEQIVFADGSMMTRADLRVAVLAQSSTSGNDVIVGFDAVDTLTGGAGNDELRGGGQSDTYIYARGDGNDTILEGANEGAADKLAFVDINRSEVTFVRSAINEIKLMIAPSMPGGSDGGSIVVKNAGDEYFGQGLEQIAFANGDLMTRADLRTAVLAQSSTSGNDLIHGFDAGDTLTGGAGNDELRGGGQSDTYIYSRGDGNDIIFEEANQGASDKLVLTDINLSDVTFVRSASNELTIVIAPSMAGGSDGGSVIVKNAFDDHFDQGLEQIIFADGAILTRADLRLRAPAPAAPTSSADVLTGTNSADTIDALGGDDIVDGLDGNDTIYGRDGNDVLTGSTGDDYLRGDAGGDIYVYRRGDGSENVDDESPSITDVDVLRLVDLNQSDVTLTRSGDHMFIAMAGTSATITISYQFYNQSTANWGIERIEFADGSSWNLEQIRANAAIIRGTSGNDNLFGTNSNDIFVGGLGDDRFSSTVGSDTFVYTLGDGNDIIDEESGSTTEVDVLRFTNLNASDVTLTRSGTHSLIKVNSTGHVITLDEQFYSTISNYGIERIEFADGTNWGRADIKNYSWFRGTSGNDTLFDTSDSNTFVGGLGNDTFRGVGGSDTYIYGSGDGNDLIDEESGSTSEIDVLKFTDLNASDVSLTRSGTQSLITVNATGHVITLDEQFYSTISNYGIDRIEFANGTAWNRTDIQENSWFRGAAGNNSLFGTSQNDRIDGDAGNDTLSGQNGNDLLLGGSGDDALSGGAGDDTFVFHAGFGKDTISDFVAGASSGDIIQVDTSLFAGFADVVAHSAQVGAHTEITLDANNKITLQNVTLGNLVADDFRFV